MLTRCLVASCFLAATARADCPTFVDIGASMTAVSLGSVAWGDYDNDGDLDLLVTGQTSTGQIARVYRNNAGTFLPVAGALTGVYFSSVAWGDADNDGDLDILLTGFNGSMV